MAVTQSTNLADFSSGVDTSGNTINVGTALTLGHTQGVQFHTQHLHATGFEVNNINASGIITASSANFNGNVSIAGTLTYEDVTNIDSVGLITARTGIKVLNSGGVQVATGATINGTTNTITALTNGSERLRITSAGNFGIGDTNPDFNLVVKSSTNTNANILAVKDSDGIKMVSVEQDSNGNGRLFVRDTSGNPDVLLHTNGNSYFNGGNVGVGTDNPALKLHVEDSGSQIIRFARTGIGAGSLDIDGDGNAVFNSHTTNADVIFHTQTNERLRITSGGELVSTNGTLRRNVSDSSFTVSGDSASNTGANINLYGASHSSLASVFRVRTGSTERLRITSDGTILAGGQSSSYDGGFVNLELRKDSNTVGGSMTLINDTASQAGATCEIDCYQNFRGAGKIVFGRENANNWQSSAGGAASFLAFHTNNAGTIAERLRITSAGSVGIGLTNPSHKLHVNGGLKGDYIETSAHAVWTQSVDTGTGGESGGVILKTNPDQTSSNLSGAFIYRVRAVVKGTGTDTGAAWLVYYNEAAAQYVVRFVSRSGTSSNHPRLRIVNTNQMELYTTHNSNYPVRVVTERFYTEEPDSTLHAMGSDYHWQRNANNLSYTDGNITTNALTANPLNLTSTNGWVRSAYGAISNSTVSTLNNLLIGQNMRGYLSGIDGSSSNNNFYHTVTHGAMGYNGIEFCYNGVMKFFAGTGGTTANNSFTPGLRFQIQNTMASFMDGTSVSQGDSVAFHNGMRSYSNRGYVAGNGTVSCTLNVANSQTTYLVIAGFNHYGLLSYGCTYMAFTATGTSGETTNIINDTPTSLGGGWSVNQGSTTQLVVSKSAGSYVGGGYWFVHIMAAS
mgnify:CR=1 FL=1|tara:strand:- start:3439 stop:5979 length:2541 start_codon:yes stop_codon:yes gene_type:complete